MKDKHEEGDATLDGPCWFVWLEDGGEVKDKHGLTIL